MILSNHSMLQQSVQVDHDPVIPQHAAAISSSPSLYCHTTAGCSTQFKSPRPIGLLPRFLTIYRATKRAESTQVFPRGYPCRSFSNCARLVLSRILCFCILFSAFVCFFLLSSYLVCFRLLLPAFFCFFLLLSSFACFCLLLPPFVCFCWRLSAFACFCLLLSASVCFYLLQSAFVCFYLLFSAFACFCLLFSFCLLLLLLSV